MNYEEIINAMTAAVCEGLGYDYDSLYENKQEWIKDKGSRHDINTPYKSDIREAAEAALRALQDKLEDDERINNADRGRLYQQLKNLGR